MSQLTHLDFLDEQIAYFNTEIEQRMKGPVPSVEKADNGTVPKASSSPSQVSCTEQSQKEQALTYEEAITLLDTIPGINRRIGEIILAEIGLDMSRFPVPVIWRVGPGCVLATIRAVVNGAAVKPPKEAAGSDKP